VSAFALNGAVVRPIVGYNQCRSTRQGSGASLVPPGCNVSSYHIDFEPGHVRYRQTTETSGTHHLLVECGDLGLDIAEKVSSVTPAKAAFTIVKEILTMVKVHFLLFSVDGSWAEAQVGHHDERRRLRGLGLTCASVCAALDRGLSGKRLAELNTSVREAIKQLTV